VKVTSHTLAPDVQRFFVGYDNGAAVLRRTCRSFPGVRQLIREKNTLQYDNLLKIYMVILLDKLNVTDADLPWAMLMQQGRTEIIRDYLAQHADHSERAIERGEKFPQDCLGLFVSPEANFANTLIVAGEIRILRWCNMRTVPTTSTHMVTAAPGTLFTYTGE